MDEPAIAFRGVTYRAQGRVLLGPLDLEVRRGETLVLLGRSGSGKTTALKLINRLLDWLHQRHVRTAFLFNSRMNSNHLFDFILAEFEIVCDSRTKSQQLMKLNQWLLERYRNGETAVVIIDEAQNLSYPVLEEIRLLTNLETSTDKLLQIVLSGQPELEEKLKLPQLRQMRQRIMLRCKTSPLTTEQTFSYINERLRIAGAKNGDQIFSKDAVETIHLYSLGIPRVINLLCEHALVNSYVEQQKVVSGKVIEDVAREFQLDEVEPVAPAGSTRPDADVYNSESFLQNLGEALSRFRANPPATTRERK